ncbi:MAG: response regulator [Bacteroidota bacterium]
MVIESQSFPLQCILLIDDDESTNMLNEMVLEEVGIGEKIHVAYSGKEALEYLQKCLEGSDTSFVLPELIFLDVNMPLMNGFEFMEAFRKLKDKRLENIKVVILTTSLLLEEYREQYAHHRITAYRNKPLTCDLALEILQSVR